MPPEAPANAYLTTKVLTASPHELRLMLLDGAIKFCRQGRDGLARKDFEACFNGYTRCRAIITELITTMRPEPDPALYQRLSGLYLYMLSRLLESSHGKDVAKADEVIKLLEYERETWALLMEKVAKERTGAAPTPAAPPAAHPLAAAGAPAGASREAVSFSASG